jgi:hypothetical protein
MTHSSRLSRRQFCVVAFLILMASALTCPAKACPDFLKGAVSNSLRAVNRQTGQIINSGDLCAFEDRYQAARAKIIAQNVNPDFIVDARAPRLINLPEWQHETAGGLFNLFSNYNPALVYRDPKGALTVWAGWTQAATYVDLMASQNLHALTHKASQIPQINLEWLMDVHLRALGTSEPGIAGKIRPVDSVEIGSNYNRPTASKVSEILAVDQNEYKSLLSPNKSILSFHQTQCIDELTSQQRSQLNGGGARVVDYSVLDKSGSDFTDGDGNVKHCGYFVYANGNEIRAQLDLLFKDIGQRMTNFTVGRSLAWQTEGQSGARLNASEDPLLIASRAQRWLVSIHPFGGGNGRTSRFFLDYIVESLGLPAPTFANMNLDTVSTEDQWARQIGIGMERVVGILEYCSTHLQEARCTTSDAVYANQVLQLSSGAAQ